MDYFLNDSDDGEISSDDRENVHGSLLNELSDYEKQ